MRRVVLSEHAQDQLAERRLPHELVFDAVLSPNEVVPSGRRWVAQKMIAFANRDYLLRVVCEDQPDDEILVITVYRTSKIAKYRSAQ